MVKQFWFILISVILPCLRAGSQDFVMQGCYWSCPEDSPDVEVDPSALQFWIERMEEQAPELAHAGFTYLWLPSLRRNSPEAVKRLIEGLGRHGIRPVAGLEVGADSLSFRQQAGYLRQRFGVRAYSINGKKGLDAGAIARDLNAMFLESALPELFVASLPFPAEPARLGKWAAEVIQHLDPETRPDIDPRVYDFPLREALRQACMDTSFDVRLAFERSIRDASALSGYNIMTMVNHPVFKNQNNRRGDWDDLMADPLLAYAYILTNNQLGLPTVYYGDYYGESSELEEYLGKASLKERINQVIKAHKEYIYGSTAVEYLNRRKTDKASFYLSAGWGVDSSRALIFQMDGTNTPAGKAAGGGKDVLVAINFAYDTLEVIHEINRSNIRDGDYFTDVLGMAAGPRLKVFADTAHSISGAVLLKLPPRAYGIWVQGRAEKVVASRISLSASSFADMVELNWDIAFESMAIGYEVERSVNGKPFERLAGIAPLSQGEAGASYLYIDKDVFPNEQLRYRIKMLDRQGGFEYSPVETARLQERALSFELLESPDEWVRNIKVKSNFDARAELALFDARGKRVLYRMENIRKGANTARLDLSGLPNGVYYLNFYAGKGKTWTKRLVKQ